MNHGDDIAEVTTEGERDEVAGASAASSDRSRATGEMYGDAVCRTPYNDLDYSKEIIVTVGAKKDSKIWKPLSMPAGEFIVQLCRHKEGSKDGPSFVLGDMVPGQRLKTTVKSLYGVGLDIDTGTPSAIVDAALLKLGCQAVRYTTHSHNKTRTDFKKDRIVKFANGREIDESLLREFLTTVEQWDETIVRNIEYLGVEHTEQGIVCQVAHPHMPKHRIVMLLAEPFEIAKEGPTQAEAMKKWAKVPEALANLLGVPFDTSCTDPSRLFYFPRHAKGKPFEISLFGGPYFDWRTLELDNPLERAVADLDKGKSKSQTKEGRDLGRWHLKRAHGFQIADVIEAYASDRIRRNTGHGLEIECPFDENHSNAGDPEDRACLIVNAGEGTSEFFTISCRHETCRDKTMLDMLGKMLADGWFEKDVLESDDYNALVEDGDDCDKGKPFNSEEGASASAITPDSVANDIKALGSEPGVDSVQGVLDRIAGVRDDKKRAGLFATAERNLKGRALKGLIGPARTAANAKWKAEEAKANGPKRIASEYPLPSWVAGYAMHEGRLFAYARGDDGELGAPLHSPLWFAASAIYPDQVAGGRPTHGVTIEFVNLDGEIESRSFTRSDAAKSKGKEDIISALAGAGVSFAGGRDAGSSGTSALLGGMLVSGRMEQTGIVFDYPGFRDDKFFLTPGGEVIGEADGNVSLSTPLPGFTRAGTLDAWRNAAAQAFADEVIEKAPHVAATLLLAFVSPLLDRAGADSMLLFLAGRSTRLKTFGCQLMASVWGTDVKPNGALVSFNATANNLEQEAIRRSGCGLAIDETRMTKGDALSDFIYRLTSNAERGRMTKESLRWCLACAISSEKTLAECLREARVPVSPGLMSRVIELEAGGEFVSEDAVKAMRPAFANYGHAGPLFVHQMQAERFDKAKIASEVTAKVRAMVGEVDDAGLAQAQRAARLVAYIALGGEIAQRAGLIPEEFNVEAFAVEVWAKASAGADTRAPVAAKVIDALNKKFRDGAIPIYSPNGDALASGSDGAVIVADCQNKKIIGPVFVLPSSTLAKISGEGAKDAAEILDDAGMMLRYEADRIVWKAGRANWANIGNVPAYVIFARNVLGEGAEDMIEEHRRQRVAQGAGASLVADSGEAPKPRTATRH